MLFRSILAGLSTVIGIAMIWYVWWLAALGFVALLVCAIGHTFNYKRDYYISAEDVVRTEGARTKLLAGQV